MKSITETNCLDVIEIFPEIGDKHLNREKLTRGLTDMHIETQDVLKLGTQEENLTFDYLAR